MHLKRSGQTRSKKDSVYWELVESYRTGRGPRQRVVAYLGDIEKAACVGVQQVATDRVGVLAKPAIDEDVEPQWVEVDARRVRVEGILDFGGYWLGLEVSERLGIIPVLERLLPRGREDVPWSTMSLALVLMRLCKPSSELRVAEHLYERSPLGDLLGIPPDRVNDDRLYRALDSLLPHKVELEKYLKGRLGELFSLEYDLLLYDVTSTYFEGEGASNGQARRGYSRDHRPDCKQICIALVVSRDGMPLGYEVFAGNRADVTTVEEMVGKMKPHLRGLEPPAWIRQV